MRLKREFLHVLPVFLFFLVFFTLINWIERLLFEQAGITPFRFFEVAVAAALIAKVVLVTDHLPIIHRFRQKPLIYGILWKTSHYWVFLFLVRLIIGFIPFLLGPSETYRESYDLFIHHVNWDLFISIQVYYLMLLFIFVTFQELAYKIGPAKMRRMFFGF